MIIGLNVFLAAPVVKNQNSIKFDSIITSLSFIYQNHKALICTYVESCSCRIWSTYLLNSQIDNKSWTCFWKVGKLSFDSWQHGSFRPFPLLILFLPEEYRVRCCISTTDLLCSHIPSSQITDNSFLSKAGLELYNKKIPETFHWKLPFIALTIIISFITSSSARYKKKTF